MVYALFLVCKYIGMAFEQMLKKYNYGSNKNENR